MNFFYFCSHNSGIFELKETSLLKSKILILKKKLLRLVLLEKVMWVNLHY